VTSREGKAAPLGRQLAQGSGYFRGYGDAHDAVHNVPLARLVFVPEHDGRLHRCTIHTIEAGNCIASGGVKLEGEHKQVSIDDAAREAAA
jgi:hypothetical protein